MEDGLVLVQEAGARGVVLLGGDGVADVGAFEVVEGEDERVEVGEFGDALAVAVRVRQAHFLRGRWGREREGKFRHSEIRRGGAPRRGSRGPLCSSSSLSESRRVGPSGWERVRVRVDEGGERAEREESAGVC